MRLTLGLSRSRQSRGRLDVEERIQGKAEVGAFAERAAVGHFERRTRGSAPVVAEATAGTDFDVREVERDRIVEGHWSVLAGGVEPLCPVMTIYAAHGGDTPV